MPKLRIPFKTKNNETDKNFLAVERWINALTKSMKFTEEGGLAVRLVNGTGSPSVKGSLVSCSTSADNKFVLQSNEFDAMGVVYSSNVPDGEKCWVVVAGRTQVLLKNSVSSTRGYLAICADTDGRAIGIEFPSSNPVTAEHFKECGHFLESVAGGTDKLAYAMIHFN